MQNYTSFKKRMRRGKGIVVEKDQSKKSRRQAGKWQGAGARDRAERRITKLGSDLIAGLSNKVTLPPDVVWGY